MAEIDLLTRVLTATAQAEPFFAAEFSSTTGMPRTDVDAAIDRLLLNGYVHAVDWVQGKGQRWAPTSAGLEALQHRRDLRTPAAAPAPEAPSIEDRTWQRGESVRDALVEPRTPHATRILLFANLAMFAIGLFVGVMRGVGAEEYLFGSVFSGRTAAFGELMDQIGAVSTYRVVVEHQWWRLVSHQFLHSGLMHLAMNMLSLFMLGPFLEAMWGSKRFLYLYLASGVIAGATVVLVGRAGAVGASGAISGLITSLGVWVWLNRDHLPEQFALRMSSSVTTSLVMLLIISIQPHVSWEGHLGGAVGGVLLSIPMHYERFGPAWQKALGWLGMIAIPVAAAALAYLVQAPHRDELAGDRRQFEYDRQFRSAESFLLQRRNRIVVPILRDFAGDWTNDAKFVAEARKVCDEGLARLQPLRDDLAALAPRADEEAKEADNIRRYFDGWHELLELLKRQLAEPERWNPARLRALRDKDAALWDLRKPLEENTKLPRFSPLVSEPDPPAAPKAGKDVG